MIIFLLVAKLNKLHISIKKAVQNWPIYASLFIQKITLTKEDNEV